MNTLISWIRLILMSFMVAVLIYFIIEPSSVDFLILCVEAMFYLSAFSSVFLFLYFHIRKEPKIPGRAIVTLIWFSFLKFSRLYEVFSDSGLLWEQEFLTVIALLTAGILVFNAMGLAREIFNIKTRFRIPPFSLIMISFAVLILFGAVLLFMPVSHQAGQPHLSFLNAVFTATSAVCVTGLVVVDTGAYFSVFGQVVILMLIQLGALGLMSFAAFFAFLIGEKMSFHGKLTAQTALSDFRVSGSGNYIRTMIWGTFLIELIGAAFLFPTFAKTLSTQKAVFYSIFHSVSAFCNAGFALYSDSLTGYANNVIVNLSVMALIVIGGTGFGVILNMRNRIRRGERRQRLTLHSKIVLSSTVVLILLGSFLFYFFERDNLLKGLSFSETVMASLFSSVTTRTAGFNTLDFSLARIPTLLMMSVFMVIGASPASTGGGIKTTTFFVVILGLTSILRDQPNFTIFKRDISLKLIHRAFVLLILAMAWIIALSMILAGAERNFSFIQLLFEACSAFGTVGLSTGITGDLTAVSRAAIIATMFLGRVGPLTLISVLGLTNQKSTIQRPKENILIG